MYKLKSLSYEFEYVTKNNIRCNFKFEYKGIIDPYEANCNLTQKFIHMIACDNPDILYLDIEKAKEKLRANTSVEESLEDLRNIFLFYDSFYFNYVIEYNNS